MTLADIAIERLRAGLSVLPAHLESKSPAVSSWKLFQRSLPTEQDVRAWFTRFDAMCLVAGAVSGNLEMIDFDCGGEAFDPWSKLVRAQAPELLDRLVIERSPSGGRHAVYRCEAEVCKNSKLAQRLVVTPDEKEYIYAGKKYKPRRVGDQWQITPVLIETRGEGGIFLCAPSPGYVLEQGDFTNLPRLTAEERDTLLELARSLNEVATPRQATQVGGQEGGRPGDDFNQRGDVRELLRKHGWARTREGDNEHWCRPGKSYGCSATLKDGVFFVFSTNAPPFEPDTGYAPFAVYAGLEHGWDFVRAASALRNGGFGGDPVVGNDVDLSQFGVGDAEDPSVRVETVADPGPFPESLLSVPGFIGDVMAFNLETAIRPQPVLALAAAIGLQSVLCARKVRDIHGNRTNLYLVGLSPSGGGKDHGRKLNRNILFQAGLDKLEGNEEIASDAGLVGAVETHPGILFQLDEFGRFLRTIGDAKKAPHLFNTLTVFMKLFSSADTIFRGKAYADCRRNKTIIEPCVSVYATSVPEAFYESLTADSLSDGFVARLLSFEACDMTPRRRVPQTKPPKELIDIARWWGDFHPPGNLSSEHPNPIIVPTAEDAEEVFDELAERVDGELAKTYAGRSLWARAEEKACRLSLIRACSERRDDPVIDAATAHWACDLVSYITQRMLYLAGQWVSDGQFDAKQKKVLRIILGAANGRIGKNELSRKTQWLSVRERDEVLTNLVATGQVREEAVPVDGPGRPRADYVAC